MGTLIVASSEIRQVLELAAELLTPEGAWCQGAAALSTDGRKVAADAPEAQARCLNGAVHAAAKSLGAGWIERYNAAQRQLRETLGDYREVWRWQDDPGRTQSQVLALLRKAAAEVPA